MQSRQHWLRWWLVPIKDLFDVAIWAMSFSGSQIEWCGDRYRILPGGKLQKLNPQTSSPRNLS
jgi:hypothetical protein